MGRRGAEGGVKGDISWIIASGTRLNVTAAFALCVGARAPAAPLTSDLVQGIIQLARDERLPRFYILAAIPPAGVAGVKDLLRAGLGCLALRITLSELSVV